MYLQLVCILNSEPEHLHQVVYNLVFLLSYVSVENGGNYDLVSIINIYIRYFYLV